MNIALPAKDTKESQSKVTVRLFLGMHITSEYRMRLNQSIKWKHDNILASQNPKDLVEVLYHGKNYLGFYLNSDKISLDVLKKIESTIKQKITAYCPDLEVENGQTLIFPQVLIA